jgi:hypothetical protein
VQAAEQGHQDGTAAAIVVERDLALSIDRGQRERGGGITRAQGGERHDERLLFLESIKKWQRHQRVGLEPGALAHRLGLLHVFLGVAVVAQIQMGGGEAIIAVGLGSGLAIIHFRSDPTATNNLLPDPNVGL